MARQKAQGVFVVTPVQFEEGDAVQGVAFATASEANLFAEKVNKFARTQAAKIKGLKGDEAKSFEGGLPLDILMQPTDSDGDAVGDPFLFGTVGLKTED